MAIYIETSKVRGSENRVGVSRWHRPSSISLVCKLLMGPLLCIQLPYSVGGSQVTLRYMWLDVSYGVLAACVAVC